MSLHLPQWKDKRRRKHTASMNPLLLFFLHLHTIITISLSTYIQISPSLPHHQIVKEIGGGNSEKRTTTAYLHVNILGYQAPKHPASVTKPKKPNRSKSARLLPIYKRRSEWVCVINGVVSFLQSYMSSHGKSCGSILVHVKYGSPPSRRSSSRKLRISGLTASLALTLISSILRSKRFRLSRL